MRLTFRQVFGRRGTKPALEQAYEFFPRLHERRRQLAGTLSGGEQRMLSLARVVVQAPKLLIADELSFGLAPVMIEEVYETLGAIRERGTSLVVIEQHVRQALSIADDVVVLSKGRVGARGAGARRCGGDGSRARRGAGGSRRRRGRLIAYRAQGPVSRSAGSNRPKRSHSVVFSAFHTP